MDLDLLRTFVAVVETGGFTRAGTRLNRTQSTVSQHLRRLEDTFGRQLLHRDRTGGGVAPTEHGEVLLGYARRLLVLSAEAETALRDPGAAPAARLGVPEDFAGPRLTDLLAGFAAAHPGLRLDTTSAWSAELGRLLDRGDLDLALVKRDAGEGRCLARWPERLVWVAGRGVAVAADPLPLALFPADCIYRRRALEALEASGRRWRLAYVGQGLAGVQAAIASGIGIGLLPTDAVLAGHRALGPEAGLPDPPATELALIGAGRRPTRTAALLADHLAARVGALLRA